MHVFDRVGFCLLLSALSFIHPPLHAQTTQQSTPANSGGGVVRDGLNSGKANPYRSKTGRHNVSQLEEATLASA
jgi:hypothetical protein